MRYTARAADAAALTFSLHGDQVRRGSGAPYITHLMSVAGLVGEYGGDEDQFIAALLHDAVEDQGGQKTLTLIRERFGERVANLVEDCSDTDVAPKPPWRARKEEHVAKVAAAGGDLKLIVAADKLHNAQCILRDLNWLGAEVWERFTGRCEGTLWYYDQMYAALCTDWEHPILGELACVVEALHEAACTAE